MARKNRDDASSWDTETDPEPVLCPVCARVIPDDQQDAHHLVPKSKGGKKTVCLHRICHDQIHATFTDAQLAKKFSTIEAILEDPAMQTFVAWVKGKHPGFSDSAKPSRDASGSGRGRKR
ncbi:HNH endonuclease [Pararhizobium antarcticum]|uniref:Restriction endonuclease n=1 Tax=Pararhizobium antarcticum TaxID=1798805 RepID=A0A657LW73_9HYPH|nr:HNH endonuclease signature motif containing protein [Pararhizobium antarcticum]OJF98718.1 restriction endonuclease [Pararhizobium antarcticum]OJF98894.1 restriction endonuclease [Pararhizobium antarcticum]OJF99139.1 restriction endonuclease [Rhizobium sp. 58]